MTSTPLKTIETAPALPLPLNADAGGTIDLQQLLNQPVLISERDAEYVRQLGGVPKLKADPDDHLQSLLAAQGAPSAHYLRFGFGADQVRPYEVVRGIAVININGVLLAREPYWGRYYTGYESIDMRVTMAVDDPEVTGILLRIYSGGGVVVGCFELCDRLRQLAEEKPIWSLVDPWCCSAAYAIASSTQRIVVLPSGQAGSVGVVLMHVDMSKMLDAWGLNITFIHAGKQKVDGNPYEPLPAPVRNRYQKEINKLYGQFVAHVAEGRGMSDADVRATEAGIFDSDDLLALGMADDVATYAGALELFSNSISTTAQSEEGDMSTGASTPQQKPTGAGASEQQPSIDLAAEKSAAVQAERERIKAITGSEHAEGRSKLAQHLAMETDMSADDAVKLLQAAPKEAASEPNPAASGFRQAMASGNPDIEPDGEDEPTPEGDADPIDAMFGAWDQKTGFKASR